MLPLCAMQFCSAASSYSALCGAVRAVESDRYVISQAGLSCPTAVSYATVSPWYGIMPLRSMLAGDGMCSRYVSSDHMKAYVVMPLCLMWTCGGDAAPGDGVTNQGIAIRRSEQWQIIPS
jgi:hypothetical protein